jgi:hypothetical protein
MIPRSTTLTAQLTRTWVAMYTAGLPEELACTRRDEIESDLWEQERDGSVSNGVALARLAAGMPADLSWRLEQRAARAAEIPIRRKESMIESTRRMAFIGGAWLMVAFTVGVAWLVAFGMGEAEVAGVVIPRPIWAVAGGLAGLLIFAGIRSTGTSPMLGGALVLVGALPMAVLLAWSVVVPLVWLVLLALLSVRAITSARRNGARPA